MATQPEAQKRLMPKVTENWEGPYVVISKLNEVTYRVQNGARVRPKVVNQDRLKPYLGENPPQWF